MEGLSPPLHCLLEIQSAIQNGEPARLGAEKYLRKASSRDDFVSVVRQFLLAWDQGQDVRKITSKAKSPHRRALLDVLGMALMGQPVRVHLEGLQREIVAASEDEVQRHLEILPIKMLIPLLFLQLPAFLLLLFGPLLNKLIEEISR